MRVLHQPDARKREFDRGYSGLRRPAGKTTRAMSCPYQPDARVLVLRLRIYAPKGESRFSPGQRPGKSQMTRIRTAQKGRDSDWDRARCSALAGHGSTRYSNPRVSPWAGMLRPRWGEIQNAQHQNARARDANRLFEERLPLAEVISLLFGFSPVARAGFLDDLVKRLIA